MFWWFGFFCSRLCTTNSGCSASNPVQWDWQSGYRRSLRYRIEMVGKLVDDCGGTTRGSFRVGLKKGTPCVAFLFYLSNFFFKAISVVKTERNSNPN